MCDFDDIAIRRAGVDDTACLSELLSGCYSRYAITDDYSAAMVEDLICRRGSQASVLELFEKETVWAAEQGGQIVGMVSIFQNEITKLFVRSGRQREGIGAMLFKKGCDVIRDAGFQELFLGVAVASAEGFYEKMGMTLDRYKSITHGPCKGRQTPIMRLIVGPR